MYIPKAFQVEELEECKAIIRQNGFASVISQGDEQIEVSQLPIVLHETAEGFELHGHFARANPQWQRLDGQSVLLLFQGPHCYVSARWYITPGVAPTWNYAAVHVYGRLQLIEDEDETRNMLDRLIHQYEGESFRLEWNEQQRNIVKGVVGFKITPTDVQGKFKLSQNRSAADQQAVIEHLLQSERQDEQAVAQLMQRQLKNGNR